MLLLFKIILVIPYILNSGFTEFNNRNFVGCNLTNGMYFLMVGGYKTLTYFTPAIQFQVLKDKISCMHPLLAIWYSWITFDTSLNESGLFDFFCVCVSVLFVCLFCFVY